MYGTEDEKEHPCYDTTNLRDAKKNTKRVTQIKKASSSWNFYSNSANIVIVILFGQIQRPKHSI